MRLRDGGRLLLRAVLCHREYFGHFLMSVATVHMERLRDSKDNFIVLPTSPYRCLTIEMKQCALHVQHRPPTLGGKFECSCHLPWLPFLLIRARAHSKRFKQPTQKQRRLFRRKDVGMRQGLNMGEEDEDLLFTLGVSESPLLERVAPSTPTPLRSQSAQQPADQISLFHCPRHEIGR